MTPPPWLTPWVREVLIGCYAHSGTWPESFYLYVSRLEVRDGIATYVWDDAAEPPADVVREAKIARARVLEHGLR